MQLTPITLPPELLSPRPATPVPQPHWLAWNAELAAELRAPAEPDAALLALLAGNADPGDGGAPTPVASVYGGHQFGVWAGRLGDGRALLLGRAPNGWEVQLKGAGSTPYSRGADGRAVLRSSIREYLCSEAMAGLGIPTTRALALVGSPLPVRRETAETAAIVTRVAPSFVRFGHFEWLDFTEQPALLRQLADTVVAEHFSEHWHGGAADYAGWLSEVVVRTARLMAAWQSVGFCHGVMNTDNFSILGLTLDYGPFGFLDGFDAQHVCNHSDYQGRYAYDQQPQIGHWNCMRLLTACLPLLRPDGAEGSAAGAATTDEAADLAIPVATEILDAYAPAFAAEALRRWRDKLGLSQPHDDDPVLLNRWLSLLHATRADFTLSFRRLATVQAGSDGPDPGRDFIADPFAYDAWITDYRARLRAERSDDAQRVVRMDAVNPFYVLRNHHAQAVIESAQAGDFGDIDALRRVLATPFTEHPGAERWAEPPPPDLQAPAVSCSS